MQQMPTEGRLFREVDGTWRQIMAACVAAPKALEVGRRSTSGAIMRPRWWDAKLMKLSHYYGGFIEPTLMLEQRCWFPEWGKNGMEWDGNIIQEVMSWWTICTCGFIRIIECMSSHYLRVSLQFIMLFCRTASITKLYRILYTIESRKKI